MQIPFRSLGVVFRRISQLRGAMPPTVEEWPLRRLTLTTNPNERCPLGSTFRTMCVDTGSVEEDEPTVVLLHDNPGSHRQLNSLITSFHRRGARVIAPNFPGNSFTKGLTYYDDITFSYSASDHAHVVDSILSMLNIRKISGLVACGQGTLPALHLLTSVSHLYSAACLLNCPDFLRRQSPVPSALVGLVRRFWSSNSLVRSLSRGVLLAANVNFRFEHPVASVDEAAYALLTHANCGPEEEVEDLVEAVSETQALRLMMVSAEWTDASRSAAAHLRCPEGEWEGEGEGEGTFLSLMETPVETITARREHFVASCRPQQLYSEAFFTDKVAALFLEAFVQEKQQKRLT